MPKIKMPAPLHFRQKDDSVGFTVEAPEIDSKSKGGPYAYINFYDNEYDAGFVGQGFEKDELTQLIDYLKRVRDLMP